ncbi:WD repeat protein [Tasmannia lanceolata]|uniref:WD repeat protein n=1 Tax=Tasmannia lanceolata TaxID=3420 RepID=UPI0040631F6F
MQVISPNRPCNSRCISLTASSSFSRQIKFVHLGLGLGFSKGLGFPPYRTFRSRRNAFGGKIRAIDGSKAEGLSPWDDQPYELLPGGSRAYLDEQDIVALLDPPKELIPLDPSSYNPASYLWKKIGDIPEERRRRLLHLLKPRLISRTWEISGTRYEDSKLVKQSASSLLSMGESLVSTEFWNCRTSGGPLPIAWINGFKKALFRVKDGKAYGRIFLGGSVLSRIANSNSPLYFSVRQVKEVMSTEQPCDLAYEFGDGLLDLCDFPEGFPKPMKHPWPFNDHVVVYVRHVGPGVLVGQAWQEGKELEQVPKKFCGEILMVKDYSACRNGLRKA